MNLITNSKNLHSSYLNKEYLLRYFWSGMTVFGLWFGLVASPAFAESGQDPFSMFESMSNEKTDFPTKGYEFPVLVLALREGSFSEIPDDLLVRGYIVSFFKVFNKNCGEPPSGMSLAAKRYSSQKIRKLLNNPEPALREQFLKFAGKVKAMQRGDYKSFLKPQSNGDMVSSKEGKSDGDLLMERYQCGRKSKKIRSNLHRLIQARSNKNPESNDVGRLNSFRKVIDFSSNSAAKNLENGCQFLFERKQSCRCMAKGILNSKLSQDDMTLIAARFSVERLNRMKSKYANLSKNIDRCNGKNIASIQKKRSFIKQNKSNSSNKHRIYKSKP